MRPTLEARELKASLLQYLSTTYALADEGAREELERFLGDETSGMFRGPYLRIRTPFTVADGSWRSSLDWAPDGFTPYTHQAIAFKRLSTANNHAPEPTLVTTGTGSGKTESFLLPVLDHCRRERAAGRAGIKAVFLYPMNALATDQAQRINDYLTRHADLDRVTAGLYIGDVAAVRHEKVATDRESMRVAPPDILLTNYKMLDLLLQRAEDVLLWQDADIRFIVVDEFHTYDGAQGTDVAMLLRRLASAVGASEPGNPLGSICPIATSATLANGTDTHGTRSLLEVATHVFGTPFTESAIVGEQRQDVEEFIPPGDLSHELPLPPPDELAALPDPTRSDEALADLVEKVTGSRNLDPGVLGANLKQHILTQAVIRALDTGVRTAAEVLDVMWRHGAYSWGQTITQRPEVAADALARFVALLSMAHDPDSPPERPRPLVHVEVHQWARAVSRLLRGVLPWPRAEFRWDVGDSADATSSVDQPAPVTTATAGQSANLFLPAVYCRDCGRSGWAVFTPESDDQDVEVNPSKIRWASTSRAKIRVRNLIAATHEEAKAGSAQGAMATSARATKAKAGSGQLNAATSTGGSLMVLDGVRRRLRPPDPRNDYNSEGEPELTARDSAFVLVYLSDIANTAAEDDWCPACGDHNSIRYLGTGQAAIAAASVTQLFTGGELDKQLHEDKTLLFNDSVQDAAHRAGFVASRSYTFSLRALLVAHLSGETPTALNDLIADVVAATTDRETLAAVVPPDLHDREGVARLLSGRGRGGDQQTWKLVGERLAFQTIMEFGLRSRQGRTLELTRTAAAHIRIPDLAGAVELVKQAHAEAPRGIEPTIQDDDRYRAFLRVFLERLRWRGAIKHEWLEGYLGELGTNRFPILGGRKPGMPAFPKSVAAPTFLLSQTKSSSEFDFATGRLSWYERWAHRCLQLPREFAPDFWSTLLPALHGAALLSARPAAGAGTLYGLQPGSIEVYLLDDEQVRTAFVRCPACFWEQTVHPSLLDEWRGQPCPSYRCATTRSFLVAGDEPELLGVHHRDRDFRQDYYRRLYQEAGTYQVVTAEHTGLLTRAERERLEEAFRHGEAFNAPKVLSCTPTLELGIDIGDLSTVILASLPRTPANYAQRVGRAGRRTGNAFLLTIPERRRRDMYYLEKPREMIAGQIIPPGCHLSAVEILRRQYLAHLLDLAAQGRLKRPDGGVLAPIVRKAAALFGPTGYLHDLAEAALAGGVELADGFLALFPEGVSDHAAGELRVYATGGLRGAVDRALRIWRQREEVLRGRRRTIRDAIGELDDGDQEQRNQKAELEAEWRSLGRELGKLGDTPAQQALSDLGLLPNYALIDTVTTLDATVYWQEGKDKATGKDVYTSRLSSFERPQRFALREFAPGNEFYANGYRHEISGMEIGTTAHPDWEVWRVCPSCGYVRTEDAANDRRPCPRCATRYIADDGSCLFKVVQPSMVTARGRRENIRIGDDRDERQVRGYEVVHAVDIPNEALEPGSWRHAEVAFGVDFTRSARIRTFNLGPARYDTPADDDFAGHTVGINPFLVCTGCGAASAGGRPVFHHDTDALAGSAHRDPRLRHHRPWCPLRRGKRGEAEEVPVLLAHDLTTEALRVLLPAATYLDDYKVHSFQAALRLGVDRHFGGNPQHLDSTLTSVPDPETGERRHYMILFDMLPSGTGYLHRLTDRDAFKATLQAAHRALTECECVAEGRRACYRCLFRYTPEHRQDLISRRDALDLLESLLFTHGGEDAWKTTEIENTGKVGLDLQVESAFEARFLEAIRAWVNVHDEASLDEDGRASGHLRLTVDDEIVHWRLIAQEQVNGARTDFTFVRLDGPPQSVKVFLDGRRFHAMPDHNRLADDARKRTRLRAEGQTVFAITWDDLELFEPRANRQGRRAVPVWPPYGRTAQDTAGAAYQEYGGNRAELTEAVFVNPIDILLAFLRNPDLDRWARRARALVSGLTGVPETVRLAATTDRSALGDAIAEALRALAAGREHTAATADAAGGLQLFAVRDEQRLPLLFALDATAASTADELRWTAVTVLDDSATALGTEEHKQLWHAWLYWSNLLQFLSRSGGDGVQLTSGQAGRYPVEVLAVCGGAGELDSLHAGVAPEPSPSAPEPAAAPPVEEALAVQLRDRSWDEEILPLLDASGDEADLARLAEALADAGRAAPTVFGYELEGPSRWPADFAWDVSGIRVAVVPNPHDGDDAEAERLLDAFAADGWTAHTATQWLRDVDDLIARLPEAAPDDKEDSRR
ncbi:RNA helicase [Mangrovactinospora gilvigrisea]|uniref:RNA helicase n=1 Tax=Mangrovactinospora gilvigrisea TaxID=1428644 RepID=A0A1J7CA40_9ACTN|nr:DEAD/DEAH box helicase [Mangrovactinospora gilvigrisea]OIV36514.1 RNA helicase [Mangrovactinospora gilvigrisea]